MFGNPSQGPDYLRNPDPLGIGLRQRSRDQRAKANPTGLGSMGPLMDPAWDAFLQALDESGASSVGLEPHRPPTAGAEIEYGSNQTPISSWMSSNHIGALEGLGVGVGRRRGGISVKKSELGPVRGSAQSKMKVQGQRGGSYAGRR